MKCDEIKKSDEIVKSDEILNSMVKLKNEKYGVGSTVYNYKARVAKKQCMTPMKITMEPCGSETEKKLHSN